jgi:FAD/FMN-containing dehydrogenase
MPIPLYNNANSNGILLSTSNLTTLSLSSDNKTLSIGPGQRWNSVANYLTPFGLAAVGGRVGKVGVPGLLLGGGISFYSSQYGFGADNIVKYQCVLSSGLIIEPTATNEYSDLFWALKGGGNSFCLVTRFDVKVYVSPSVWVGIAQYDSSQRDAYLNAVYTFGAYGSQDSKAAIIPTTVTVPAAGLTVYAASKFYDAAVVSQTAFQNFTPPVMTPVVDTFTQQPLSAYLAQTDPLQPDGLRQEFRTVSFTVNKAAVTYVHDTFLSRISELSAVTGLTASFTYQPVSKNFIQAGINAGGNPQGVNIGKAPYFWVVMNWSWQSATDDAAVHAFALSITQQINTQLITLGVQGGYTYMNDAGLGQQIFQSYPAANLARLKSIRTKYDPLKFFTNLLPGGWKVANA